MLNYPEGKSSGEDLKHQGFWKILMLGILLQSAVAKNGVVKDDIYIYMYIYIYTFGNQTWHNMEVLMGIHLLMI